MTEGAAELKDHKMAVNDSDKVVVLLQGVPASYNLIVSQLMNKTGTTFKEACKDLRVHKMTLIKKSHNQRPNEDEKSRRRKKKSNRGDRKQDHTMLAGNAARTTPVSTAARPMGIVHQIARAASPHAENAVKMGIKPDSVKMCTASRPS